MLDHALAPRVEVALGTTQMDSDHAGRADVGATPIDAASLWPRLMAGEFSTVDHECTREYCSLLLHSRPALAGAAVSPSQREVIERVLAGVAQKVVGDERVCSTSTISATASAGLHALGLDCPITRIPLALAVIAAAHALAGARLVAECRPVLPNSVQLFQLRLEHPHEALRTKLTAAEHDVARLLLDGLSHDALAERRRRSPRTIANQLHSISRKLRVSNRLELIRWAVARGAGLPVP